jgi:hypothetical protein
MQEVVQFALGLKEGFALFRRQELYDLPGVLLNELNAFSEQGSAVVGRGAGPAGKTLLGGLNGRFDILWATQWNAVYRCSIRWIGHFDCIAVPGFHPFPVNKHLSHFSLFLLVGSISIYYTQCAKILA